MGCDCFVVGFGSSSGGMGMVNQLSKRGWIEWLWQRVTAVVIIVFVAVLLSFFLSNTHGISYIQWLDFYSQTYIRVLTVLATAAILWHAWIGIWTALTDYVKCACLRRILEVLVLLFLAVCGVWSLILMCG